MAPSISPTFPESTPRTPRHSEANPLGVENWGTPPPTTVKITNARTRQETPGSVIDKMIFNTRPDVLKELLPYLAMGWAPEETSGAGMLCAVRALSNGLKNVMRLNNERIPPWTHCSLLLPKIRSNEFKKYHRAAIKSELAKLSSIEEPPEMDSIESETWDTYKEAELERQVDEAMVMANTGKQSFFSVEELSHFVRYLNDLFKRHFRLGIVATHLQGPTGAYILDSADPLEELHYPVVWLHNLRDTHWESIGPNPGDEGIDLRKSWQLTANLKTVVNNGLYRVKTDVIGQDPEYKLSARKDQWVYEVAPPKKVVPETGYIYVHTTKGPNADGWRAPKQGNQETIRGQEGLIPVEALDEVTRYGIPQANIIIWREKKTSESDDSVKEPERPSKRPTTESNFTAPKTPVTKPKGIAPKTSNTKPKGTALRPTLKPTPKPVINTPKPPGAQKSHTFQTPVLPPNRTFPTGNAPNGSRPTKRPNYNPNNVSWGGARLLRMFWADATDEDATGQQLRKGFLSCHQDQIVVSLDIDYRNLEPDPCRVRTQDGQEGWVDVAKLREIPKPFGLDNIHIYSPVSYDRDAAYPEDKVPLTALRGECDFRRLWSLGTRESLITTLMEERRTRGLSLELFRTKQASGAFANDEIVHVLGDPYVYPDQMFTAFGIDGRKRSIVAGHNLVREPLNWNIRVKPTAYDPGTLMEEEETDTGVSGTAAAAGVKTNWFPLDLLPKGIIPKTPPTTTPTGFGSFLKPIPSHIRTDIETPQGSPGLTTASWNSTAKRPASGEQEWPVKKRRTIG